MARTRGFITVGAEVPVPLHEQLQKYCDELGVSQAKVIQKHLLGLFEIIQLHMEHETKPERKSTLPQEPNNQEVKKNES